MKTKKEETFNSEELLEQLSLLLLDKKFKKPNPLPIFKIKEALFIRDLIFQRPKDIVFFYLTDYIRNRAGISGVQLFNGKEFRRYSFVVNFLKCRGNATKAAILSGYSPRSAKQQGHRVLRYIQSYFREQRK